MVVQKKGSKLVSSRVSYVFNCASQQCVQYVHLSLNYLLVVCIPAKFLFSQPSEPVVCVSVFICRYMWVAYVNKWLWCDTNNPAHCTCVGAWQSWFVSGHTHTQILGMLPKNTFTCGQADERETDGSKSRGVWSTSAELRGEFEASWKCCKVQEDHSTHRNSQHLVKFVYWPTFQLLQLIRGSKPHCSSYL